ncbi:DUF3168 domain-containing protein [uncultured Jannaschia sp.]|uniref:DUF3168 domain-containing protein n=1 Tax=uncultured Jannaschia sp. TaxID=293347 RepID=UPI002619F105|nr:DUF3168 domain-containing protein [uncultured Jannaschia sp.]
MTYAISEALQLAVYQNLATNPVIAQLTGGAIFDSVPDPAPDLFIAMGPEKVRSRADSYGASVIHEFRVSIVTRRQGFRAAKAMAAKVSDSLIEAEFSLSRGTLVSLSFLRAEAKRDEGEGTRRIDLWFRARLDDRDSDNMQGAINGRTGR